MDIKSKYKFSFMIVIIFVILLSFANNFLTYKIEKSSSLKEYFYKLIIIQNKLNTFTAEFTNETKMNSLVKISLEKDKSIKQFYTIMESINIDKSTQSYNNLNVLLENNNQINLLFYKLFQLKKSIINLKDKDTQSDSIETNNIKNKIQSILQEIDNQIDSNEKLDALILSDINHDLQTNLTLYNGLIIFLHLFLILSIILIAKQFYKYIVAGVDEIEEQVNEATLNIQNLNQEIENTQKEVVFTMGAIGETRSKETGNHVKRVAKYSKILALHYGLDEKEAEMLKQASPMHDIGKVGIADSILNKPARFTQEEREIMNTHAQLGYDMLKHSKRPLLKTAAIVAYEHHEKWDGTGYPRGLSGESIHIYGRITAISDVFDALGSDRCYKKAWEDEKIFKLFKEEKGKHFDPKLVDIFFQHLDEFLSAREQLTDIIK